MKVLVIALALASCLVACQEGGAATHRVGQSPGTPAGDSGVISGGVTDGTGEPIEGVNISIDSIGFPFTSSMEGLASTSDGTFESREPAGNYRVSATLDGETKEQEITVEPGEVVEVVFEFD